MASSDKRARQKENTRAAREAREAASKRSRRNKTIVRLVVAAVVVAGIAGLVALVNDDDDTETAADQTTTSALATTTTLPETTPTSLSIDPAKQYTATITTNFGDIVIELDTEHAPIAANQFVELARDGFYDGLLWHRVATSIDIIQGGDPNGDGTGGSGSFVVGEVPTDGYPEGSVAAAKKQTDTPGTFDSQFFIVTGPAASGLTNDYARFGTVVEGLDVAREIQALAPETGDGAPTSEATIDRIVIAEA